MDWRTFVGALTIGLLAAPHSAEAQQAGKVYRSVSCGPVPFHPLVRGWSGFGNSCATLATTARNGRSSSGKAQPPSVTSCHAT